MKMNRLLAVTLSLCMLAGSVVYHAPFLKDLSITVCASVLDDYAYSVNSDGTATITKYTGTETEVVIPSALNGRTVTGIGKGAFEDYSRMTSVVFPSGLTSIGEDAFFHCDGLTSVIIPGSVATIGAYAFDHCSALTSVTIGNGVTEIGPLAFFLCTSLTSVNLPESLTTIGSEAFGSCTALTSISIPENVTNIDLAAFEDCTSLTAIHVSEENQAYSDIDGVLFNKEQTVLECYPAGKRDKSYTVPDSVSSIGEYAFYTSEHLTSVTLGIHVSSMKRYAFAYCINLAAVTILNPNCRMIQDPDLIYNGFNSETLRHEYTGIIYGYDGSTAQSYANKMGCTFEILGDEVNQITGDINADGMFNTSDVILLQKWLLAVPETNLSDWKAADFTMNNKLDVLDLCLMKRKLIHNLSGGLQETAVHADFARNHTQGE